MISVGIIGYGVVGKAVGLLAVKDEIKVVPHDLFIEEYSNPQNMLQAYNSDFVFICVPTPQDKDGTLNVDLVVESVNKWKDFSSNKDSVLVIKSTVPPGCTKELCELYQDDRIVFNPEFLSQARARQDFLEMDDIVIGGDKSATYKLQELYKLWDRTHPLRQEILAGKEPRYSLTDSTTAEMVKIARNSFYALKVAYSNQIYDLCQALNIDYNSFREIFAYEGKQSWVNPQHTLVPGPDGKRGFGGSCLPKDSSGLRALAAIFGVDLSVLESAIKYNLEIRDGNE